MNENELYSENNLINNLCSEIAFLRARNRKLREVCEAAKNLRFEIRSLLCILEADAKHDRISFSTERLERAQEYVDKLTAAIADVEGEELE